MTTLSWDGDSSSTNFRDVGTPTDPNAVVIYPVSGIHSTNTWDGGGGGVINGTGGDDLIFLDWIPGSTPRIIGVVEINGGAGNDLIDFTSTRFSYGNTTFHGGDGNDWIFGNDGNDILYGDSGNDRLKGYGGDDKIFGGNGGDHIFGGKGNDYIDGGDGTDSAYFSGSPVDYKISKTVNGYSIEDKNGTEGIDVLVNIERVVFSGARVALDTGVNQSGGKVALLLATCFGSSGLSNQKSLVDTLLSFFDAGNTLTSAASVLVSSGIAAQLAGGGDGKHIVKWIGHNVLGNAFSSDLEEACLDYVESNGQADFISSVAALGLNVDIVGLQKSGIEFS